MDSKDPAPADDEVHDRVLGECLDDFTRRRGLGEPVSVEDYRARLGADFGEFLEAVATTDLLDSVLTLRPATPTFPRTFGRYTLLAQLGRGSVGMVYDAQDRELGRRVALKVLRPGFDTDPAAVERFRSEARHCALVRHPSIVVVHEAGLAEGQHYYTMERVEGHTLASLVKGGRAPGLPAPPPLPVLLRGLADVADALGALHAATAVHRDVKPSNLMVQADGRFVLADFGLARTVDSVRMTRTGQMMGTLLYSSPEQVLGRRDAVDARSDVYGLGATLYEAVSGRPPFDTDDAGELMKRILEQRPAPPSQVAEKDPARAPVPAAVDRVVLKCLEKRPEDRYPTMAALKADLLALAEGREPEGKPVGAVKRWGRDHRVGALVACTGVAAALVFMGLRTPETHQVGILTIPSGSRIEIEGRERAVSPCSLELAPGTYRVVARRERFKDLSFDLEVPADPVHSNVRFLDPIDPTDAVAEKEQVEGIERLRDGLMEPKPVRASAPLLILSPRGGIALDSAALVRLATAADLPADASVRVRLLRGGQELAHVDAPRLVPGRPLSVEVPAGWSRAAVGDAFTLEAVAVDALGIPVARADAALRIVTTSAAAVVAEVDRRAVGAPPRPLRLARAVALLNRGLCSDAFAVLSAIPPAERTSLSDAILCQVLGAMELTESNAYAEAAKAVTELQGARPDVFRALYRHP